MVSVRQLQSNKLMNTSQKNMIKNTTTSILSCLRSYSKTSIKTASRQQRRAKHSRKAFVTLAMGKKKSTDYRALIDWARRFLGTPWSKEWDCIIFHEGNILPGHQDYILNQLGKHSSIISFRDVGAIFGERRKEIDACKEKLSITKGKEHGCPTGTFLQNWHGAGYKAMISFWYFDVAHLDISAEYDFYLRLDDDCVIGSKGDPTPPAGTRVASAQYSLGDNHQVVMGMNAFFYDLAHSTLGKERNWTWPWKRDALPFNECRGCTRKRRDGDGQHVANPYTNSLWLDLAWVRSVEVQTVHRAVEATYCVYTNRWGDSPLWGGTMRLLNLPTVFLNLSYIHGSHRREIKPFMFGTYP